MNLDQDARVLVGWDATANVDLSDATVQLQIGATTYPMEWAGLTSVHGQEWSRRAQSVHMLAGTARVPQEGDVQLAAGQHVAQVIVTLADGQVLPARPFRIFAQAATPALS